MSNSGFMKGLLIGGVVGASVGMMLNKNSGTRKSRKKMMDSGSEFLRKSGRLVNDVVDLFR
jgi:gas vesicle protein